jgi:hypothetical protein
LTAKLAFYCKTSTKQGVFITKFAKNGWDTQ